MRAGLEQKLFIVAFGLTVCLSAKPIHAAQYINIEADSSTMLNGGRTIESHGPLHSGPASWSLGSKFYFATKWDVGNNVFYPNITTAEAFPGHKSSFELVMEPILGHKTPGEKMLLDMVLSGGGKKHGPNTYASTWDQTKTLGFAMKLASDFEMAKTHQLMFWEWYQLGSPTGAVVSMDLGKDFQWGICIHLPTSTSAPGDTTEQEENIIDDGDNASPPAPGDTSKANPSSKQGRRFNSLVLPGTTLKRNQWYYFVVSVKPSANKGEITVWQDGVQIVHNDSCPIGFDYTKPLTPGGKGHPDKNLNVCIGLYRAACHDKSHVYMDMLRWGDTYADVAPNPPAVSSK